MEEYRLINEKISSLKKEFKHQGPYFPCREKSSWQDIIAGKKVLIFGSGDPGSPTNRIIFSGASEVCTVDNDKAFNADFLNIEYVDEYDFDTIICEHVFEHIKACELNSVLSSLTERLKPGGSMLITLPNIKNFGYWFDNYDHKNHIMCIELAAILEACFNYKTMSLYRWSNQGAYERHLKIMDAEPGTPEHSFGQIMAFLMDEYGLDVAMYTTILMKKTNDS